jgi:hypothetical protein
MPGLIHLELLTDLFNKIGQEPTSRLSSGLKKSRQLSASFFLPLAQFGAWRIVFKLAGARGPSARYVEGSTIALHAP